MGDREQASDIAPGGGATNLEEQTVAEDVLEFERDGHVARVWLNRPHRRNAITLDMLYRLDQIIDEVDADPELRVLVLRGREGTFCSGYDLGDLQSDYLGSDAGWHLARVAASTCARLYQMRTPSVAVVDGHATAGGFELMISSDFAVVDEDARIGDFHIRRGLIGGAGPIYRVPRMIGVRKTKELLMTGRLLTGREAERWGLVNVAAPAAGLDDAADEFVGMLTDKSPLQLNLAKMTVDQSLDASVEAMKVMEQLAVVTTFQSDDAAEGVAAFLEKRPPEWSGR